MLEGRKAAATKIVYGALEMAEKKVGKPALEVLEQAAANAGPDLELKSRRIGGANYQVPIVVMGDRKATLAHRWIIEGASSRKGTSMINKLAEELMAAAKGEGVAMKKREDVQKMAEANKAFAHFA